MIKITSQKHLKYTDWHYRYEQGASQVSCQQKTCTRKVYDNSITGIY